MASSSQAFSIIKLARNQVTGNAQAARDNEALRLGTRQCSITEDPFDLTIKNNATKLKKLSCYESVPVVLEVDSRKFQNKVLDNRRENDMRVSGDSFSGATCLKGR